MDVRAVSPKYIVLLTTNVCQFYISVIQNAIYYKTLFISPYTESVWGRNKCCNVLEIHGEENYIYRIACSRGSPEAVYNHFNHTVQ